jgi:hypothetical protein
LSALTSTCARAGPASPATARPAMAPTVITRYLASTLNRLR